MKKQIIINKILSILFIALIVSSCGSKSEEASKDEHHEEEESVVELSPEQVKTINLKLGKLEMKSRHLRCCCINQQI